MDESLATVRTLASRPKLTSPNILMAAIEHLVEIANKTSYKAATLFLKSLSICKRYEDNEEFCSLVLKLFGSSEDKKNFSVIADWAKPKKIKRKRKIKYCQFCTSTLCSADYGLSTAISNSFWIPTYGVSGTKTSADGEWFWS